MLLRGSHLQKLKFWTLGLVACAWLFGLVTFVAADGYFEATLPRRRASPAEIHNLSLWDLGPTVRASSYHGDWAANHHPLFLVDGRERPELVEKWASAERDHHPWVEITWRESHDLERVVLRHAGSLESAAYTARRYTLRCLTEAGAGPSLVVNSNEAAVASHDLACRRARGIRIEFDRDGADIIRLFEVETWGR
jgi:hypothetical protein